MKNKNTFILHPARRRGFTLTEVLLAVLIVGLIAVALASLMRAASREAGVGRSRIILRNNLAGFMRTLRNDLSQATLVSAVDWDGSQDTLQPVLHIARNVPRINPENTDNQIAGQTPTLITYCFQRGDNQDNIVPESAYRGGKIYRVSGALAFEEGGTTIKYPACNINNLVLDNVKYIPEDAFEEGEQYPVPLFQKDEFVQEGMPDMLSVKLIVELNSTPIINDVIEETFTGPMGY